MNVIFIYNQYLELREREREMFYLTTHSTHFIYGYMASDIWLRTILIVRKETHCRHIGYSYRLAARVLLYAPSHRQDNTYHGLCYTSRGALAGTRNSSMGPPHEGSIRRPTAPWANALPLSYVPLPLEFRSRLNLWYVFKRKRTIFFSLAEREFIYAPSKFFLQQQGIFCIWFTKTRIVITTTLDILIVGYWLG